MSDGLLVAIAMAGIFALLFLVIQVKLHAFVALMLVSLVVGVLAGMPLESVIDAVQEGMGSTLGFVAVVVGLGAIFGQMLEVSGGAQRLARTLIAKFGEDNAQWALGITGFLVAIPVFFDVAFIILVAVIYDLSKNAKRPLLYYGVPLIAGLSCTHAFIPPTPGPVAVADLIGADLGWVILFGAICGFPAMVLAGPLYGRFIAKRITVGPPAHMMEETGDAPVSDADLPSFNTVAALIGIPLVLILLATVSDVALADDNPIAQFLGFVGHPFTALLIATLLTFYLLGTKRGVTKQQLEGIANKAMEPAGIIILVTGAGGVFKQVLINSGVGDVLGGIMASSAMPPLVIAFLIAAAVRLAQGSATVAMVTAAGLVTPLIQQFQLEGAVLGLMTIAIAAGATIASHVNDSGFWLVNRYFGLEVADTLKSWTVVTTIIAFTGFAMTMLLAQVVL
ncbi:GntT/GntP/DsdX family permease [Marinivivus vitaminiproducens]|uniref:GntT/GntP/DsdX family permease n=1 Tax=Marinivivus vitaminiproducens TaxID=3035935 RepID=UPI002797F86E|nr:gluconate:H+ symporter [Geminicoccaceae bacterium SCSIO 64248]